MNKHPKFTQLAAEHIRQVLSNIPLDSYDETRHIPTISWLIDSTCRPNFAQGPVVSIHDRRAVSAELIVKCHDLSIVYNFNGEKMESVYGMILDFDGERLVFVSK